MIPDGVMGLPASAPRAVAVVVLALAFVAAGVLHFVEPRVFEAIVPPSLPAPRVLVLVSGAAEIAGGIGLLLAPVRPAAGVGLVLLLIAVFPANLYMARQPERFRALAPAWALWARLPLQGVLIALVAWAAGLWP